MKQLELFNTITGTFVGYKNNKIVVQYLYAEFSAIPKKDVLLTIKSKFNGSFAINDTHEIITSAYLSCNEWEGYIWIDAPIAINVSNGYIIWTINCRAVKRWH